MELQKLIYVLHLCLNWCFIQSIIVLRLLILKPIFFHFVILSYSTLLGRILLINNTTVTIALALYIYYYSY